VTAPETTAEAPPPCLLDRGPVYHCAEPGYVEIIEADGHEPLHACLEHALWVAQGTLRRGVGVNLRPLGGAR
jgi:hypothetical protein